MIVFLLFLNYLGYTTARLIDQALIGQTIEASRRQILDSRTRIATQVQLSMLPAVPPYHLSFDIAGQSIPARAVGGDFYSYHKLAKDRLAIIIGDVSGKGMPAALLMAVTTGIIDSLTPSFAKNEPAALLEAVAIRLRKHIFRSRLNTACLIAFFERDRLRVVNAGCIEPIIRRGNGQVEWLNIGGLPLGTEMTSADLKRNQAETFLNKGDMAIFVTDGVVEAKNTSREMLGFERLQAIVAAGPTHSVEAMKLHILDKVEAHRGLAEQNDDVTVIVVQERETSVHVT
jgi:serine phosphatase RsbU (regulator of sigma subunit)